jgi:hypothetical protein
MSTSPTATDRHQTACDALEHSTPVLVDAVRRAPADARPARMRWTNAEIAAHLYASAAQAHKLARGVPSAYDGVGPSAQLDEKLVADVRERDVGALADLLEQTTTQLLSDLRALSGDDHIAVPGATVSTLVALLATDHHLHGGQLAETSGALWAGSAADLQTPIGVIVPYAFAPEAARGFSASYTVRLKGVEPIRYAVVDGELQLDVPDRTDCTISTDPQTFLRMGVGVVSQLHAIATLRVRTGGRKPWLASRLSTLFPTLAHGGVVSRRA